MEPLIIRKIAKLLGYRQVSLLLQNIFRSRTEICTYCWNTVGLTNEEKLFFFDTIHSFVKKHNLCNFKTYYFTISNFMANNLLPQKVVQNTKFHYF